jgi:exodeoxyribonuclease VII small subunit
MKAEKTYQKAYDELLAIIKDIEEEKIQLDKLPEKVSQAKELLAFCAKKLRDAEDSITKAIE